VKNSKSADFCPKEGNDELLSTKSIRPIEKKKKCGGCGEGSDALMDETDKRWKMEQMVLFGCR